MGKFIRLTFGPVHFQTRFLPFVSHNKETLHNYYYLVDAIELYKPYQTQLDIFSIDDLRKDHPWSKEKETIFYNIDSTEHIKNFRKFCCNENQLQLLPGNVLRFAFKELALRDIKNVCFIGNNVFMTNKQEVIDKYFESIPEGTFHIPFIGPRDQIILSTVHEHLHGLLKEKFPNLIFPETHHYIEGFQYGVHFKNKEHMLLFYEIWDFIVEQYNIDSRNNWFNIHGGGILGYTRFDDILGYLSKIFEVNFDYNVAGFLDYWNSSQLGFHVSTPHDTWYYINNVFLYWKLPTPTEEEHIYTVKDYVKKYRENLQVFYENHCVHCNFLITKDNDVIITHKNL